MSILRRSEIPLVISGVCVLIILIDTFAADKTIRTVSTNIQSWAIIMAGFALGIGCIKLIMRQVNEFQKRISPIRSVGIVILLLVMLASGIVDLNLRNPVYLFLTNNVYSLLYGVAWSFQYFFLFYGLYRAYRVRNIDSLFMTVATILLILKSGSVFETFMGPIAIRGGDWLLNVPVLAGNRAITISASLGIMLIGLRVLLGKERGYMRTGGG